MAKRKKKRKTRKKIKRTGKELRIRKSKNFKTRKVIKSGTEKEISIKITKAWIKKAYVNKRTYEKKRFMFFLSYW